MLSKISKRYFLNVSAGSFLISHKLGGSAFYNTELSVKTVRTWQQRRKCSLNWFQVPEDQGTKKDVEDVHLILGGLL